MARSQQESIGGAGKATDAQATGSFTPPTPQELSARIPSLEVIELLGYGGMGMVYKGRQPLLDRLVAIKVLRPDLQVDAEFNERFLHEARTLAALLHPYIVTVFDFGKSGDLYYFVMEYVEGNSLRRLLGERAVSIRDTLDFVPQITQALEHAHQAGIVHRDVKPENILVDRRGRIRLVDFGLATLMGGAAGSDAHRVAGTPGYMAPEQIAMPQAVDHRADIYSTGVVFYEMLTGVIPGVERIPPSIKAATDQRLDPIVLKALEHERQRRYQEARQIRFDLAAITQTPESTIRLEQTIPAVVDQVFAAWTDPAVMTNWLAPTDDFTTPIAEVDLRVGGRYRIGMQHKDKPQPHIAAGQYCQIDPPRSLSFTWAWDAPKADDHETQLTLEFRPSGDSTNLTLIHERFRDEVRRNDHAQGWQGCLRRLARRFDGGRQN
jgi:serine/threonine protein kinase